MQNKDRAEAHKRNKEQEEILSLLNEKLLDDEEQLIKKFSEPLLPTFFIIGNPRSGTTLLYQWLASTGVFSYPSNIVSRFYNAPFIGALIQKLFVDFDKFGEILGSEEVTFSSNLGKTKGALSPNEFWYFWRRFFKFGEIQKISEQKLEEIQVDTFLRELAALETAVNKPLLMKGMILNWNLGFLNKIMPNPIFLYIKREDLFNVQSLYKARLKYFGDVNKWYSFKPPEYSFLKDKSVYEQLAGQVIYSNRAIATQLKEIGSSNYITIKYSEFCSKPEIIFKGIIERLNEKGYKANTKYEGPVKFDHSNRLKMKDFDHKEAQLMIDRLQG